MKRNIIRNFFGVVLVLIIITSIFLVYKNIDKKEIKLDNVSLNEIDEYSGIAFMIEQTGGEYEKSENNDWPTKGYKLNQRLSGCVDESGNTIEKAVRYEYGTLKVKTRVNASCYLYFDRRKAATEELIATVPEEQLWDSTLENDGYRYVGTNPNNYICFGTTDQEECENNTDKYMYRIIGIFEDEDGVQHLKLIKKEALNTAYQWHSDATTDTDWDESDLYKGINGSYFATNSEYSYMQDSAWNNIITTWEYTATNTKTYENYNSTNGTPYGPYYYYNTVKTVYLHEMNRSSKTSQTCYYSTSTTADCSVGEWKPVKGKISLMYASDYALSLGAIAVSMTGSTYTNRATLKTGWMHISNNDSGAPDSYEWTSSRYGARSNDTYLAWYVDSAGSVDAADVFIDFSVRPVFYLESDVELKEGLGTINEPYMISQETAVEEILATVSKDQLWKSTLEDDGYRYVGTNPDNYICFGTTDQEECKKDTDKYMYRIIGIFENKVGQQHLKLIKKEALNTAYSWHSDYATDTDWDESDLYKGLNGSYFAMNSEYSYMQDSVWNNLITTWEYIETNTKVLENYNLNNIYGIDYFHSNDVKTIYLHEMNRSSKTSQTCYYNADTPADCSVGEWHQVNSKIGLMYVSDYLLSLGNSALGYTAYTNRTTLKTGWVHLSNNDSHALSTTNVEPPNSSDWTMSRNGKQSDGFYREFRIHVDGNVDYSYGGSYYSARPVFYLESDIKLEKGTGTISDPYTIKPAKVELNTFTTEELIEKVSSDVLWKSTLEDDGYRFVGTNPSNYVCFGYSNAITDCDFSKATNTDLYAYRIIGIFEDSAGTPHIKLIKKEALNSTYAWNADYKNDVDWDDSDLYKGINGDYFLDNPTYSYMQDTNWTNKIAEWEYTATNTQTYNKYDTASSSAVSNVGANYYYSWPIGIYNSENKIDTTTGCYQTDGGIAINCKTTASYTYPKTKISLMYASDYALSLGATAVSMIGSTYTNRATLKTGWMHISNNDMGALSQYEWTSSRYVGGGVVYGAWFVGSDGRVGGDNVGYDNVSVRPVFYLTSEVELSGEGTIGSPYIIS